MDTISKLIGLEEFGQAHAITLIPSENYASQSVRWAVGSVLMNKYSEGYSGKRYYQGNRVIDEIESIAVERAKDLFGVAHANVQPYSGSPANSEVLFALCNSGETILGMSLSAGGHLTHGHPNITFSGKFFKSIQFGVRSDGLIDYEEAAKLVKTHKPKVMLIGTTAYPRALDWKKFSRMAESVGAYFVADISHVVGLVIAGVYPDPAPFAHVITTTTHKTLRGPRGAMIMVTQKGLDKDSELDTKIDRAVFPGMQGGPHNNTTAAIAIALEEATRDDFKSYGHQIVKNAQALAENLKKKEVKLVSDGTDSHLMLVDLKPFDLSGNVVAEALEVAGIIVNKNSVPGDTRPFYPSGIRIGTPAVTTRGMKEAEMGKIADWIKQVIDYVKKEKLPEDTKARGEFMKKFIEKVRKDKFLVGLSDEVREFAVKFPVP